MRAEHASAVKRAVIAVAVIQVAVVTKLIINKDSSRAGALVQWLWEETHVPKVVGSNPGAVYWMEMTFFHIDLL